MGRVMSRLRYCAAHHASEPHEDVEFDAYGRAMAFRPDKGERCAFCGEDAVYLSTPKEVPAPPVAFEDPPESEPVIDAEVSHG
jgi:hypothetical protein